jgi:hypothetical protein
MTRHQVLQIPVKTGPISTGLQLILQADDSDGLKFFVVVKNTRSGNIVNLPQKSVDQCMGICVQQTGKSESMLTKKVKQVVREFEMTVIPIAGVIRLIMQQQQKGDKKRTAFMLYHSETDAKEFDDDDRVTSVTFVGYKMPKLKGHFEIVTKRHGTLKYDMTKDQMECFMDFAPGFRKKCDNL